jgi:uncharacterized protein YuzE
MTTVLPTQIDAPAPQLEVDVTAKAAYITLRHGEVVRTRRFNGAESIILDFDAVDQPLGIEVIGLNTDIPVDALARAYGFSEALILQLKKFQQALVSVTATTAGETGGHSLVPAAGPGIPLTYKSR